MKILICDDIIKEAEDVKAMLHEQVEFANTDIRVCLPQQLMIDLEEDRLECDVVILDIEFHLDAYNGIDIGRLINQKMPNCEIIYLTGILEFAPDVYETKHVYFVMKDNMKRMLPRALEVVKKDQIEQKDSIMEFVSQGRTVYVNVLDLIYIEKQQRQLHIITKNADYECYSSLRKIVNGFSDRIVRCHGGFVVNLAYIRVVERERIILENGTKLPIGRTYRDKFMEQYLSYCTDRM